MLKKFESLNYTNILFIQVIKAFVFCSLRLNPVQQLLHILVQFWLRFRPIEILQFRIIPEKKNSIKSDLKSSGLMNIKQLKKKKTETQHEQQPPKITFDRLQK